MRNNPVKSTMPESRTRIPTNRPIRENGSWATRNMSKDQYLKSKLRHYLIMATLTFLLVCFFGTALLTCF